MRPRPRQRSSGLQSCWLVIGQIQEFHDDGVKEGSGTAATQERQQPRHPSWRVHRSGVARQQGVKHGVHHGGQICCRLLGHSDQDTGEGGDVRLAVILPDLRGDGGEELVSVATVVIAVPKNI